MREYEKADDAEAMVGPEWFPDWVFPTLTCTIVEWGPLAPIQVKTLVVSTLVSTSFSGFRILMTREIGSLKLKNQRHLDSV